MPTRNVVLTDRQAELIEKLVASGQYQNASEVLRDGLRLLERREREEILKLEALRRALDEAETAAAAAEAAKKEVTESVESDTRLEHKLKKGQRVEVKLIQVSDKDAFVSCRPHFFQQRNGGHTGRD